jgi:hypothetical protein
MLTTLVSDRFVICWYGGGMAATDTGMIRFEQAKSHFTPLDAFVGSPPRAVKLGGTGLSRRRWRVS